MQGIEMHRYESVLKLKLSILKKALERINEGADRIGPNTFSQKLSIAEVKAIAETALESVEDENDVDN